MWNFDRHFIHKLFFPKQITYLFVEGPIHRHVFFLRKTSFQIRCDETRIIGGWVTLQVWRFFQESNSLGSWGKTKEIYVYIQLRNSHLLYNTGDGKNPAPLGMPQTFLIVEPNQHLGHPVSVSVFLTTAILNILTILLFLEPLMAMTNLKTHWIWTAQAIKTCLVSQQNLILWKAQRDIMVDEGLSYEEEKTQKNILCK